MGVNLGVKRGSRLRLMLETVELTKEFGAGSRTRTDDLLITNQLLYQLSYAGKAWTGERSILARAPGLPRRCSRRQRRRGIFLPTCGRFLARAAADDRNP